LTDRIAAIRRAFQERFGGTPLVARAPGRVNLIGEHTDYNDGYVLPMAINREVLFAVRPRSDREVRLYSLNFQAESSFSLDRLEPDPEQGWSNYVRGVAQQLLREGLALTGMEGVVEGNVPIASGLSSSAAMEVAALTAFQALGGWELEGARAALLCQQAENEFMGVRVGIMDQFISRLGRRDHALFIDCRSLTYEPIPLQASGHVFMVADSRQSRELASSAYNVRRGQCEQAVEELRTDLPEIQALRDVTLEQFARVSWRLGREVARRARHVIAENDRVLRAIAALRGGRLSDFGALMNESHESLRYDYEVSSRPLDVLVAAARQVEGCLGARLTGAGFGGCTVSLVQEEAAPEFQRHVSEVYQREIGPAPHIYVCTPEEGAGVVADSAVGI
jgi:galactokinase